MGGRRKAQQACDSPIPQSHPYLRLGDDGHTAVPTRPRRLVRSRWRGPHVTLERVGYTDKLSGPRTDH